MGRSDSGGGCRSPARHGRGWRREHDPNAASVSRRRRALVISGAGYKPRRFYPDQRTIASGFRWSTWSRTRAVGPGQQRPARPGGSAARPLGSPSRTPRPAPGLWRADFHTVPLLQVARTRAARRRRERLHLAGVLDTSVAATAPSGKRSCGRLFCLSSKAVVCPRVLAVFSPSVCATLSTRCARSVL